MCVFRINSDHTAHDKLLSIDKKSKNPITYKVMLTRIDNRFECALRPDILEQDVWYTARKVLIRGRVNFNTEYTSGFHSFVSLKDAKLYRSMMGLHDQNPKEIVMCESDSKSEIRYGTEKVNGRNCLVLISDKIKIKKQEKKRKNERRKRKCSGKSH